jgi:NAD(P)-dependent dehydrogenase (short-subunit alcohol dehydrogenase family)
MPGNSHLTSTLLHMPSNPHSTLALLHMPSNSHSTSALLHMPSNSHSTSALLHMPSNSLGPHCIVPCYLCQMDSSAVSDAFRKTKEAFGTIDIVVNNAGILDDRRWKRQIGVNVVRDSYLLGLLLQCGSCRSTRICRQYVKLGRVSNCFTISQIGSGWKRQTRELSRASTISLAH